MVNKLFVYGSLAPGRPNEHILKNIGGTWEEGIIYGKLHQEGWGATMGFPGIVLDIREEKIRGHVFSSEEIENHWEELDKFEGEEYERVLTKIELENGLEVEAFVYVLQRTKSVE